MGPRIKNMKRAYRICTEALDDMVRNEKKYPLRVHMQRMDSLYDNMTPSEGIGYLVGMLRNMAKHPYETLDILTGSERSKSSS